MNPYKVLGIDHEADKREILAAVALALRERKHSGKQIAEAQKELMDPVARAVHDFIQFIDVKPLQSRLPMDRPAQAKTPELCYLPIFQEKP